MTKTNSALEKNVYANFYGIGVQLLNQIVLVPLYLVFWGINLYGDWIVIYAIAAFFSMSDIGLNTVSCNKFVISYQKNNTIECNSIINNNYLFLIIISTVILAGCFFYIFNFDITTSLGLRYLNRTEANFVFIFTVINVLIGILQSVVDSIYRAISKNHFMVFITNTSKLLEFLIIFGFLIFGFPITLMVVLLIVPNSLMLIYKLISTRKHFKFSLGIKFINIKLLKEMTYPALAYMSFPAGNNVILQGFTLIVNRFFGAELLVLFNTTRTLCNFTKAILLTIQQSVWPEFSIAYGKKDTVRMRVLHQKAFAISNFGAIIISIFLLLFGNIIYTAWIHGSIPFSYTMMMSFLIVLFFENMWTTSSVTLMAINKHVMIGTIYVFLSLLVFVFVFIICRHFDISISYMPLSLLIIHIPLIFFTIKRGLIITEDSLKNLIKESFAFIYKPVQLYCKRRNCRQ